ncbi:MAG: chloride channel protein, partial [Lachnospiraceae bacterium]|nr:chloride channel protein [Lachnospiraceae bacterium]
PVLLIGVGIGKIFLTNICIQSGWKGGHFFPVIFAGVSIGYGMGMICSVEPVFAAAVVTSALLGYMMKKPVAVVLLMMLCFSMDAVVWMLAASAAGAGVSALLQGRIENTAGNVNTNENDG